MSTFKFKTLNNITKPNEQPNNEGAVTTTHGIGSIVNLTIRKQIKSVNGEKVTNTQGEEFKLIPWNTLEGTVNTPLISLQLTESLIRGIMYGSLVVNDFRNWTEEFGFVGDEVLWIYIKIPGHGRSEDKIFKSWFKISEIKTITNDADTSATYEGVERLSLKRIYFSSEPLATDVQDFLPDYKTGAFIGAISTPESEEQTKEKLKENTEIVPSEAVVNSIFAKFKEDFQYNTIDESANVCYLKNESSAYPWGKPLGGLRIFDLLNYVTENTVDKEGNPHYFWWHDRTGWNFKNLTNGEGKTLASPVDGFIVTIDETNPNRISEIQVIKEYNFDDLMKNNAFISTYSQVVPNWDKPYSEFTNHHDSIDSKIVEYVYGAKIPGKSIVEENELISENNKSVFLKNKIK